MSVENDYVLVPRQATPEMLEATRGLFREWHEGDADCVWSAMIEAADAIPCSSGDNGFRNAFYEIAALLGLSAAQSTSPRKVYETQILPRLKAMLAANNDHLRRLVGKLDQWRLSMSYNESYFGEPAGLLKSTVRELALAVDPIYPPKPEPIDPLAGVTIATATVPISKRAALQAALSTAPAVDDAMVERLQKVAEGLKFNRETHVIWRDWLLKSSDNEKVNPHAGNAKFHDDTIKKYDEHLATIALALQAALGTARQPADAPAVDDEVAGVRDTLIVAANNPVAHGGLEGLRQIMRAQARRLQAVLGTVNAEDKP